MESVLCLHLCPWAHVGRKLSPVSSFSRDGVFTWNRREGRDGLGERGEIRCLAKDSVLDAHHV